MKTSAGVSPEKLAPEALAQAIDADLTAARGRNTAQVRALRRKYSRQLKGAAAAVVVDVARRVLAGPTFEHRFVAYELVAQHPAALATMDEAALLHFGHGLDSWWMVDTFACYLSGPAWREGQVSTAVVEGWARSPDPWWRRAALVSTVPLNLRARGGRGDTPRTLALCALLVADRDDMVVKALSWALRELAKHEPAAVQAFVHTHAAGLAPRVRREVANKLTTGLKNPRK